MVLCGNESGDPKPEIGQAARAPASGHPVSDRTLQLTLHYLLLLADLPLRHDARFGNAAAAEPGAPRGPGGADFRRGAVDQPAVAFARPIVGRQRHAPLAAAIRAVARETCAKRDAPV